MKIQKFTGGIDFAPSTLKLKELFRLEPELYVYEPIEVMIPFDQHIGAPNEVQVAVGDRVQAGQIIAMSEAEVSGHVHASITGEVTAIREVPNLDGGTQTAVVIRRELSANQEIVQQLSRETTMAERVREAGVVGLGGATFPTHVKLKPADHVDVRFVVLNGAECEPFIHADDYLMQREAQKIIRGGEIARELLHAEKILVGIEADKPLAIAAMQKASANIVDCEVHVLPIRYPQGGEKQLLETLIGAESPMAGRTVETGAYTMNVATSKALAEAVDDYRPLTRRYVTITGDVGSRRVVEFPLGTCAGELIAFCGGFIGGPPIRIIHGGPMMGRTLHELDTPLTKGSNGLVVLNRSHDRLFTEEPCIRCNRCVASCPIRLEPQNIDQAMRSGELVRCEQLQAEQCINCGCCSYVCPSRRHLAATINEAKQTIGKLKKEAAEK